MKLKNFLFFILISIFSSCQIGNQTLKSTVNYPKTQKKDSVSHYFDTKINDPYLWLEDDMSSETSNWVDNQNKVTEEFLSQITFKENIKEKLKAIWNYEKNGIPFVKGDYTYYYKNDGLQNQYVLYRKDKNGVEEIFIDPNSFSVDGTTSLSSLSFSENCDLLAYTISEGGSDWRKIIVIDTKSKKQIEDTLVDVKFSGVSWFGNEGFYYSSYDKPNGSELSSKTEQHKLYYHQLYSKQSNDKVVYGDEQSQYFRYVSGSVTKDNQFLIISAANTTTGNRLFIKSLKNDSTEIISLIDSEAYEVNVLAHKDNKFYIETNFNAPNNKIISVRDSNPQHINWEDLIPENNNVLSASIGGDFIFAKYMKDVHSNVLQYDFNGKIVRDINLPSKGKASGFSANETDTVVYFSFTNYYTPSSIFKLNVNTGISELYWKPNIDFDSGLYESKQIFYTSKDGTKIPMTITYKKGLSLNGKTPTILYGYGGFNVSLMPSFKANIAVWLEMGYVYAVANLRGGGEYGSDWHKAGIKKNKQNVFDDFIAAAEYLIDQKYTSSHYLAISGRSNGGLLVGATLTQRPDLMKVALPGVGVLDMLRYHKFTAGAGWAYDYGTSDDDKEMFDYLYSYSPVHNVRHGIHYPATLILTGDHDDRVVPAHSFKFAAELQEKSMGDHPQLIRIEKNAGHGAGTPVNKLIEQEADIFSFILFNMGVTPEI